MGGVTRFLNRYVVPALAVLSENTYLSAIRAGMVAIVPLTIVGGLFLIAAHLPVGGWEARVAPYAPILEIPVTATFGLLALFACLSIAHACLPRACLACGRAAFLPSRDSAQPDVPDRLHGAHPDGSGRGKLP